MLAYIAIFLSVISITLMIVILIRFKKLFSTQAIVEKTQAQINRVITDVNNNTNRDIELINEATKRTRALLNDADRKMDSFKEATQRLRDMIAEVDKKSGSRNPMSIYSDVEKYVTIDPVPPKSVNNYIDPDASYRVTKQPVAQQSLFDEPENDLVKDETKVTKDGAAYKEVPLIITKVFNDKAIEQGKNNKQINDRVQKLFMQGMNVEEIASELSCSISEIQFIIDML